MSNPVSHSSVVRTKRLLLRPLVMEDAPGLFLLRSNPLVAKYQGLTPFTELSQAEDWTKNRLATAFAVELMETCASMKDDPSSANSDLGVKIIGTLGSHHSTQIGYQFHPSVWGKGYATEALFAFIGDYWIRFPAAEFVEAWIDLENTVSQAVAKKCGFEVSGETEEENETGMKHSVQIWRLYRPTDLRQE